MLKDIVEVRALGGYRVRLRFEDGVQGELDLGKVIRFKGVFAGLADEREFAMPIRVGERGKWTTIRPTTAWTVMKTPLNKDTFEVATDLYYVSVTKQ